MSNPFDQFDAPQSGPIMGPPPIPKAPDPIAQERLDISRANQALAERKFQYQMEKDAAEGSEANEQATANTRAKLIATIGKLGQLARDANDNGGWFETGTSGSIARSVLPKGTAGYSLAKDLETVQARFAFDALQAMRDASKTGGALGQVTERELDLLKSATAAIDPDLDHETFLRNVEEARQAYLSKLAMIDPQVAARMGYDSAKAEQAWMGYNNAYAKELGYEGVQEVDRSQPTTQAYPDDIDAIMKKYGVDQ